MGRIAREKSNSDARSIIAPWHATVEALACELAAVRSHLAAIERALKLIPCIPEPCHRLSGREERDTGGLRLVPPPPAAPSTPPSLPGSLSPREVDVLRLIAAGLSNREMAAALCRSERTIERHIENIYHKIGAHNKAEATAFALRNGLD